MESREPANCHLHVPVMPGLVPGIYAVVASGWLSNQELRLTQGDSAPVASDFEAGRRGWPGQARP